MYYTLTVRQLKILMLDKSLYKCIFSHLKLGKEFQQYISQTTCSVIYCSSTGLF